MNKESFVRRLQACDGRVKIGLSIVIGVCAWRAGPQALVVFALAAGILAWLVAGRALMNRRQFGALVLFVGLWTGIKAVMELIAHNPAAVEESLVLGARLTVLVLVGLCLAALTSRVQVGRAVSSLLRPVLKDKSWQGAMSLALMIHFIPLTLRTLQTVRRSLALRGHGLPLRQRLYFFVTTVMRVLSRTTWDQTLALAVRGLEDGKAWQRSQPLRPREWIAGGMLGTAIWILSSFG